MTERIYNDNGYIFDLRSKVVSSAKTEEGYLIELDRTAIFPGGGGQPVDVAYIDGQRVLNGRQQGDTDLYLVKNDIEPGTEVECKIDREMRIKRLQSHSGEHIISGLIHTTFGYENVGFHMDEDCLMTIDLSGELSSNDIATIEKKANEVVFESHDIRCWFPTEKELQGLSYRSKKEIEGKLRIVSIEGCDDCACCAPHLNNTAQVGMIKILTHIRWRGGTRITVRCGLSALEDYGIKIDNCRYIGEYLAVKQNEAAEGFKRYAESFEEMKKEMTESKKQIISLKASTYPYSDKNIVVFDDSLDNDGMRFLANSLSEKAKGVIAVFSKGDRGYRYLIKSCGQIKLKQRIAEINDSIKGHGGGSDMMITGVCEANEEDISRFFGLFE